MAFTCARASAYDFSDAVALSKPTSGHCTANVHRIVQISFVSCYSTNEEVQPQQQMECVTKKVTRACYHRKLTMPKADSVAKCQQSYAAPKVLAFAELDQATYKMHLAPHSLTHACVCRTGLRNGEMALKWQEGRLGIGLDIVRCQ